MDWLIERLGQTSPTFDYKDLRDHPDDFKRLLELRLIKHTDNNDYILCDLCDEEHPVIPFRNSNGELVINCSGSRRVVDLDELKILTINRGALTGNINSKNAVIEKELFEQTIFARHNVFSVKNYSGAEEPITLKPFGIIIRGKYASRGGQKFPLNPVDRQLVYFLYYKFIENRNECFKPDRIALDMDFGGKRKSGGYLKNRISNISLFN
jgi:hypothetical protein